MALASGLTPRLAEHQKVRSVALVRPDDPGYVASAGAFAAEARSFAPKLTPSVGSHAGQVVEDAARAWVAATVGARAERVVAAEVLPWGERSYRSHYLEVDVVAGHDRPRALIEVKFTSRSKAVSRGVAQIARARDLAGRAHPGLAAIVLVIQADRGGEWMPNVPGGVVSTLHEAHGALDLDVRDGVQVVCLPVEVLYPHMDATDVALVERARDEADILVAERVERDRLREAGVTELPAPRPQPRASREDVVAYRDDDPVPSPFSALLALASA